MNCFLAFEYSVFQVRIQRGKLPAKNSSILNQEDDVRTFTRAKRLSRDKNVSCAVKPNPLNNCTIKASLNQSAEILEVECVPGYDGGLHQEFRLEAYEVLTGNLRVNASSVSADLPIFRIAVADLLPATHFYLVTYAVNAKGRSEVSLLEDIMLRDSEKHTGNQVSSFSFLSSSLKF